MTDEIRRPLPPILDISREMRLPDNQYITTKADYKDLIVYHHTVGGDAKGTYRWWLTDPARVGTAYMIGKDGQIYELFDPDYWAYHLKIGHPEVDARSVGIEIVSEGALTRVEDWLYAFDGKKRLYHIERDKLKFYDHGKLWRGYQYFDRYDPPQMESLWMLTVLLIGKYRVLLQTPKNHLDADRRKYWDFKGVLGHHHLRSDKTDLHPGFDWRFIVEQCRLTLVE